MLKGLRSPSLCAGQRHAVMVSRQPRPLFIPPLSSCYLSTTQLTGLAQGRGTEGPGDGLHQARCIPLVHPFINAPPIFPPLHLTTTATAISSLE